MEIGIQYQYGCLRFKVKPSDTIKSILQQVGQKIHVDPNFLSLSFDPKFSKPISNRDTVLSARLKNKIILYLKSPKRIPKSDICKLTERTDIYKDYLAPGETEITPEMKRIQRDFSKFSISSHFIEHRNALKPHIDFQDESSCYAFRIGKECITRFQAIALQSNFSTHRIGFLFGRVNEITGKVTAHVLVEPLQENNVDQVIIKNDEDVSASVTIAKMFGMRCVGMAISHQPDQKFPMTAYMVQMAAYYQNLFGEYFTTLVVMPQNDIDVVIEAFQVSDAAMQIERENLFEGNGSFSNNDNPKIVKFKEPLDTCNVKRTEADVNLLLCAVRVRLTNSKFVSHSFPCPSQIPSFVDLERYFNANDFSPTWYLLFDFNLLLFIYEQHILTKKEIQDVVNDIIKMEDIHEETMNKIRSTFENIE